MPDVFSGPEHARPDVALRERGVLLEVRLLEGHDLGRLHLRAEPLLVDRPVPRYADRQRRTRAVRVHQHDEHVLQRVRGGPLPPVGPGVLRVHRVHQRVDGGRVRSVDDLRGGHGRRVDRRGLRDHDRLDVGGVPTGRADEGVLTVLRDREELLRARATHRTGHRLDDHVVEAEPVEDVDVRLAVQLVRRREAVVVDVERVRVLHHELAPAQHAGPRPRLVAVLVLDLVDRQRQVLVRRVEVLHDQREHLLVRRPEQHVGALAILQPEDVRPVLGPAAGRLVGLAGQQRREHQLLRADRVHLLAHDPLDVAQHAQPQRQPGVDAGRGPPDVPGADEQFVARDLRVRRVLAKGAEEQRRHTQNHGSLQACNGSGIQQRTGQRISARR